MLISIDWIKDFVKLPNIDAKEMMTRFTLSTAEVEDVVSTGGHLKKISVVEITNVEKHPQADNLNLVTFIIDEFQKKTVVCGAPNVKIGLKVPYASLGTTFPDGLVLTSKKIRGILSEGMLCSAKELGISQESSGLMELSQDAEIGKSIIDVLGLKEEILLDIDNKSLTHRPDLWGHFGMAREFAAVFDRKLNNPYDQDWEKKFVAMCSKDNSPIKIQVEKDSAALGYFGISVDNIEVKESPDWMKVRLNSVGLKPINNIVDISNYVMLELGIPNHIFDRNVINGDKLKIDRLGEDSTFITLDEEERKLIARDTVISDINGPLVIAGIMGGLKTSVTEKTNKIFIEVANWKSFEVRETSTRLGLRTDSSQRYEKSLDSNLMKRTMFRIFELVLEICPDAKIIGKLEYDGKKFWEEEETKIITSCAKIKRVLGKDIDNDKILQILESLDFRVSKNDDKLEIIVPTFRATKDIEVEEDIFEEVGRIIGYDNIEEISPRLDVRPVRLTQTQKFHRDIKDFMTLKAGAFEIMTYPMIGNRLIEKACLNNNCLSILNHLSEEHSVMRDSLIPGVLDAASKNVKHYEAFKFFEIGRTYHSDKKNYCREKNNLVIVYFHKTDNLFMNLANDVEKLLNAINVPMEISLKGKFKSELFMNEEWIGCHPHEYLNVKIMGKMHGAMTSVHPIVLKNYKIKGNLSIAIIDISVFEEKRMKVKTKYKSLSKYPSSVFDWTVMAKKSDLVGEILNILKKVKIKEMKKLEIVDIYPINETENTITLRATFEDPMKTLSREFIDESKDKLVKVLDDAGFPLKM